MSATTSHWRVRAVVPPRATPAPPAPWIGYVIERVRQRRNGLDGGLYVVRTPDRCARVAIVRGLFSPRIMRPHSVHVLVGRLELGAELARLYPAARFLPDVLCLRDGVGDFRRARLVACQFARALGSRAHHPTLPSEDPTHG